MKKYMILILFLVVLAATLIGCGKSSDKEQAVENEADTTIENGTLAETNMVPTEDTLSLLEYCNGPITLRFSMNAESGSWVWVDEPTFPLDGTQVDAILTALKELGQLQKAPAAEDMDVYGLSDPQKYLKLKGETVDGLLYIGSQAEDGSWYASIEGYDDVYLLPDAFMQMLNRSAYDMALLPALPAFTAEKILSVTVENSTSRVYMNQSEGQWKSTSSQVADRAGEVVSALSSMTLSKCFDFLPSQQALNLTGFSAPTAVITVEYINSVNVESTFTLTLGALRSAEEGYYTTINDDSTIYLIPSTQVSPLLVLLIYAK